MSKPLRPSVRFEVFKRDGFACAYCNRRPPDVTLEVDHIIPVIEGGSDDPENLITACWDCNRGKGATPLDERAPVPDVAEQTEMVRERELQLRAYHAAKEEVRARQDEQFGRCWNYWFELYREDTMSRYHTPGESALRDYIDRLGVGEVQEAMRIAHDKYAWPTSNAVRYLFGILKRKRARAEGRIVACSICGKDIVLDPGQDTARNWYHTQCAEDSERL